MSDPFIASKGTDNIIKGLHFEKGTGQPASKVTAYWDGVNDRFLLEKKDAATNTTETLIWDTDALLRATDNEGNIYVMGGSGSGAASYAVTFKGNWDAMTNTPALSNGGGGGVQGDYYVVTAASGTILDGNTYAINDWVVNQGGSWGKVDNTVTTLGVETSGTPSANEVAYFTSAGKITGYTNIKFADDHTFSLVGNLIAGFSSHLDLTEAQANATLNVKYKNTVFNDGTGSPTITMAGNGVIRSDTGNTAAISLAGYNTGGASYTNFITITSAASPTCSVTATSLLLPTGAVAAKVWTCTDGTGVGSWQAGGGAAGSTTNVQYNNSGAFGGNSGFTYDGTSKVTVSGDGANTPDFVSISGGPSNNSGHRDFYKSTNTFASPAAVADLDVIGRCRFFGYDGSSFIEGAKTSVIVDGTVSAGNVPMRYDFYTNGLSRLAIAGDGGIIWTGITTANSPALSAANSGTIFYDNTLQQFRASMNGGAYANLIGGGGGITGSGTTGTIPKFTGATAVGDSVITESSSKISVGGASFSETLNVLGTLSTRPTANPSDARHYSVYPGYANDIGGFDILVGSAGILFECARGSSINMTGPSTDDAYFGLRGASNLYFGSAAGNAHIKFTGSEWTFMSGASVVIVGGVDIALDTTTGTKLGTGTSQKLGFWNKTPIIQPAGALQAAITDSTGGAQDGTLVDVTTAGLADPTKVNDNFTDVFSLLDAMRTAMVNAGLMKGAA